MRKVATLGEIVAQRCGIGFRAPLLDEPLSALDAKLRQELRAELEEVLAAIGSTAIVATHDQEEAMSLGERVFINPKHCTSCWCRLWDFSCS